MFYEGLLKHILNGRLGWGKHVSRLNGKTFDTKQPMQSLTRIRYYYSSSPLNPSSVFLLPWHGFVLTFLKGTTAKNSNNAQNVMEEIKLSSFTYRPADERILDWRVGLRSIPYGKSKGIPDSKKIPRFCASRTLPVVSVKT